MAYRVKNKNGHLMTYLCNRPRLLKYMD